MLHGLQCCICVLLLCLAVISAISCAGILGENLKLPDSITQTILEFFYVNVGTLVFCLVVFASILLYIRLKRLL